MKQTVAQHISSLLTAIENCKKRVSCPRSDDDRTLAQQWLETHKKTLNYLSENYLPSGSGFDKGTSIDIEASQPQKLVLDTGYHHMNDVGVYDGWTRHRVTVRPSFTGYKILISGKNRNDIKELIHQEFEHCLSQEVDI